MNFYATQAKYLCNEFRINVYMTPKHKTCKFDREKFCGELSAMTILRASLTKSITFTGFHTGTMGLSCTMHVLHYVENYVLVPLHT